MPQLPDKKRPKPEKSTVGLGWQQYPEEYMEFKNLLYHKVCSLKDTRKFWLGDKMNSLWKMLWMTVTFWGWKSSNKILCVTSDDEELKEGAASLQEVKERTYFWHTWSRQRSIPWCPWHHQKRSWSNVAQAMECSTNLWLDEHPSGVANWQERIPFKVQGSGLVGGYEPKMAQE